MGVFVEKDYRVKRKSSENGRKSAFAHKVKNGGENYKKMCGKKLTGRGKQGGGCKNIWWRSNPARYQNSIDYMSRESQLSVMNESGQVWQGEEIKEAKEHMVDAANDAQHVHDDKGRENKKSHKILCFPLLFRRRLSRKVYLILSEKRLIKSILIIALYWVITRIRKEHPHVHVVFRIKDTDGKRTDIKKKRFKRDQERAFVMSLS